jgi:hypothetical protein
MYGTSTDDVEDGVDAEKMKMMKTMFLFKMSVNDCIEYEEDGVDDADDVINVNYGIDDDFNEGCL